MERNLPEKVLEVIKIGKQFGNSDVWENYRAPLEFFNSHSLTSILPDEELKTKAKKRTLQFLDDWGRCFPFKSKEYRIAVVDALVDTLAEVKADVQKLQGESLLEKDVKIFAPWDREIKKLYGYGRGKPTAYVDFLRTVRKISLGFIEEFEGLNQEAAKERMIEESSRVWKEQNKPFLKVIDEVNWHAVHTGELGIVLREKFWNLKQVFHKLGETFDIDFKFEGLVD
ncbi:MAG: hypothetical protein GWO20_03055 [Candidatus Korarchaeota archaeon]|nr:hypothetical protein [Candidatus Korarchaeota archaeon]NIU82466.1 hypothetical protein [Candidatus Thorarchaeota archaeon]NIW15746.1 hypothetical protein [Candidatus Thorarchaeota archaeon]NIW51105.1 hypothetical protein [Candidatus Korarchaeota archaeon]